MNGPHWIKQWINNLAVLNEQFRDEEGKVDFEALGREEYQFRMALITQNWDKSERARDTFMSTKASYDKWVENGKNGGRPRKDSSSQEDARESEQREGDAGPVDSMGRTDAPSRTLPLPTWENFLSFVDGEGLDYSDAREWWEMTMVDRKGLDRYGKPIGNWKAALKRFCAAKINNRRSA